MSPTIAKPKKAAGKTTAKTAGGATGMCKVTVRSGGNNITTDIPATDMNRLWKQFPMLDHACSGKYTITLTGERHT